MKKHVSFINFGLAFLLLFCLAFACKNEPGGGADKGKTTKDGYSLPAGEYQCATTVAVYSGGSYNFTYQVRDKLEIFSNGTYRANDDAERAKYIYDTGTGSIEFLGEAFGMAQESRYDTVKRKIFMKMGNENWDCGIEGQ